MNVVFLSPNFPPQFFQFCTALRERGVKVLGLGDSPPQELNPALHRDLAEYYYQPNLDAYEGAQRAVGYLMWKHGRIDRIDSHSEHWLGLEARLREDFNIPGPKPPELHQRRTKSGMARLFRHAEVPCIEGELLTSVELAWDLAERWGFPLVFKPDLGVGAASTFKVESERELEEAVSSELHGYIVQPFIHGSIVSFDGLADREGRIVFETSHAYNSGVMEVVNGGLDLYYWSRREIPFELSRLGRKVVEAFGVRERFFHIEFFELADGGYRALEINLRPPGGFTTDMMNYTADIDVYRLWAAVLSGEHLEDFRYERQYHVAHVSRRFGRRYAVPHEGIVRELKDRLLVHRPMPPVFAGAMGDEMYLVRDRELSRLHEAIRFIQSPG
ncbi:MAG: ATP-grasp domain-containing protein [Myxococcales bacterium]|nr:ATP-grasp domain-containing protein [Myxococcales bacterium]